MTTTHYSTTHHSHSNSQQPTTAPAGVSGEDFHERLRIALQIAWAKIRARQRPAFQFA